MRLLNPDPSAGLSGKPLIPFPISGMRVNSPSWLLSWSFSPWKHCWLRGGLAVVGSVPSPPGSPHLPPAPGSVGGSPPSPGSRTRGRVSLGRCGSVCPTPCRPPRFEFFQGERVIPPTRGRASKHLAPNALPQRPRGPHRPSRERGGWWDAGRGEAALGASPRLWVLTGRGSFLQVRQRTL